MTSRILAFFSIIAILSFVVDSQSDRVKLSDLKLLRLYRDRFTQSKRTPSVPQLKCINSFYRCQQYAPFAVQCYNTGSDGVEIQVILLFLIRFCWLPLKDLIYKFIFFQVGLQNSRSGQARQILVHQDQLRRLRSSERWLHFGRLLRRMLSIFFFCCIINIFNLNYSPFFSNSSNIRSSL